MEDQIKALETKIAEVFSDLAHGDPLIECLYNYVALDEEDAFQAKQNKIFQDLQTHISAAVPSEPIAASHSDSVNCEQQKLVHEAVVRQLTRILFQRHAVAQAEVIASIIHRLAVANCIPPRLVCISLLNHEQLKPDNTSQWITAFKLVKEIIPSVDYKGVREIMKLCLERSRMLPCNLKRSQAALMQVLEDLLALICDPDAALLPGYLVVNELVKLCPDYNKWPHWRIAQLLTDFVENFQRVAQLLSISNRTKLRPIVEHSGHSGWSITSWKLDSTSLKYPLKGALPYAAELLEPQPELLGHVLRQPHSKDMVVAMFDMTKKKQRIPVLEEQLIELILSSLKACHAADLYKYKQDSNTTASDASADGPSEASGGGGAEPPWQPDHAPCPCHHISQIFIQFVLPQLICFQALVQSLHSRLHRLNMREGRDHLMWILLQYLSGTIQKYPFPEFLPVLRLIEFLYPETVPLPVPESTDCLCVVRVSAMCILNHILRKAQTASIKTPLALPPAFTNHNELIKSLVHNHQLAHIAANMASNPIPDYRIALLLNAYSTNMDMVHRHTLALTEGLQGMKSHVPMPSNNCMAYGATVPLSMIFLDALTIHVKISLIQNFMQHISKQAQAKSTVGLSPALVETYARLLVYVETENIGIKQFVTNIITVAFKYQVWGMLHALLEMYVYRVPHSPPLYRVQLLTTIHHVQLHHTSNMQFHVCLESVALRLITGLGNTEVISTLARFSADSKTVVSLESEELNKVLVLCLARAIHVTGYDSSNEISRSWTTDLLKALKNHTPHSWPAHTMQCFPKVVEDFYKQVPAPHDSISTLKKEVEEEYCKWRSMSNEIDIIAHFSHQQQTTTLFLCLLFKMVLETERVPAEAYKILERLNPRQMMAHVRTLCDFLVLEFSNTTLGQHMSKCVSAMNALIWQYHIISIDRFMLCMAMRTQEGSSEAQVCMFIIQLLLLRPQELKNRVNNFVAENSPEHWKLNNWYDQHIAFHCQFPEKFSPESLVGGGGGSTQGCQYQALPVYFSNVCLRFLPVLDIIIHRFLEVHQVHKRLEMLLEQLGALYKFHDHPITYLYNTLHYYEVRLRESPKLKRQLVAAVIGNSIKPPGWALTEEYLATPIEDEDWSPGLHYYTALIRRLVRAMRGECVFPRDLELRFNEFANIGCHAVHVTCVELMALPVLPDVVAEHLIDVILKRLCDIPGAELGQWINAVALVLTWLPESYWVKIHLKIIMLLQSPELTTDTSLDIFRLMKLETLQPCARLSTPALITAIVHAFWHHSTHYQFGRISSLLKDMIRPLLRTEAQLLCVYQLVGPFLFRINADAQRKLVDITLEFYHALAKVDMCVETFEHQDAICDVLYHIKYMFTGDSIKSEVEGIIKGLRPDLQKRLRFITHLNLNTIQQQQHTPSASDMVTIQVGPQQQPSVNSSVGQSAPQGLVGCVTANSV